MSLRQTTTRLTPLLRPVSLARAPITARPASTDSDTSSKSSSKPQPKIFNESPPKKGEESEDVRKHNEEMDKRADRAAEVVRDQDAQKDKVSKGFWSGREGGVKGGTS